MARAKGKQKSTFHDFTMLHNEFIDNTALNAHEKLVFIAIKRHLNKDTLQAFPSLATISKHARISKRAVQRAIETLTDKGIIQVEHRKDKENNGNRSNEYTLYDYKSMWTTSNDKEIKSAIDTERQAEIASGLSTEILQRELEKRNKGKGLDSAEPTKVTAEPSTTQNNLTIDKDSTKERKSQDLERYTLDEIREIFGYDEMLQENPHQRKDIDSVMSILHTAMNTTKPTIRIAGQDRSTMAVIGKLMKLDSGSILYAIEKYQEQTERIGNPVAYMSALLYNAMEQFHLDIQNQVRHDMYGR